MQLVEQLMRIALLGSEWVLYLLMILSVLSLTSMAERWWYFRRNERGARGLRDAIVAAIPGTDADVDTAFRAHPSCEARTLASAWRQRAGGPEALQDALDSELAALRPELESGLTFLGTIGNNAPFIGLFGTVIGVIVAFQHLGEGGEASMGLVMGGIAEALVATGVGIFVAIPAVIGFNVSQARVAAIENEIGGLGKLLMIRVRRSASHGSATGASDASEGRELPLAAE